MPWPTVICEMLLEIECHHYGRRPVRSEQRDRTLSVTTCILPAEDCDAWTKVGHYRTTGAVGQLQAHSVPERHEVRCGNLESPAKQVLAVPT